MLLAHIKEISEQLDDLVPQPKRFGKVTSVVGTIIEATGLDASVGELHTIHLDDSDKIQAEVVGLKHNRTLLMPLDRVEGIKAGCLVERCPKSMSVKVSEKLLGRIVDANGVPIDGRGPVADGNDYPVHNAPPGPMQRKNIDELLETGVRAIDALISVGKGQRMGIFAGSGVGKSTLMGMIARNTTADVNVIGLIGERGREVKEFIDEVLGKEGLSKSIIVATTSDKAAMSRVKAAYTATAIAEYFRDQDKDVLLMMDSITRVAMAQREIGLASGEPPTTKGYTPSVFTMLPKLLERAGRKQRGSITGLYTVLVDNDDMNEPIADAVRSILDGHIVLSRKLAHKNHYPAIDVLASVSRIMNSIVEKKHIELSREARELLAVYNEAEDLINIGAYSKGTNKKLYRAIDRIDDLNDFLRQSTDNTTKAGYANIFNMLNTAVYGTSNTNTNTNTSTRTNNAQINDSL